MAHPPTGRLLIAVEPRGLGTVAVESGFVLHRGPGTGRAPDGSFRRRECVPRGDEADRLVEGTPDALDGGTLLPGFARPLADLVAAL